MKLKLITYILISVVGAFALWYKPETKALAQTPEKTLLGQTQYIRDVKKAYRYYKQINSIPIQVTTVVEVPFDNVTFQKPQKSHEFAVYDQTLDSLEPSYFIQQSVPIILLLSLDVSPRVNNVERMTDSNLKTYAELQLNSTQDEPKQPILTTSYIYITTDNMMLSSQLQIFLDTNINFPDTVAVQAVVDGSYEILLAPQVMRSNIIRFPQTTSSRWLVILSYKKPLRITEISLNNESIDGGRISQSLRFLAQPNHFYRVYYDPDRNVTLPIGEASNLATAKGVFRLSDIQSTPNYEYEIADTDMDTIPNAKDNCPNLANLDQLDVNRNGKGDVCDDFDHDGVMNSKDNCQDNPNSNQKDTDGDGIGDVCDKAESRITEKYKWIPWLGIGFAGIVLLSLFVLTAKTKKTT